MSVQSAESLLVSGNQAFVDEDYPKAKESFTMALELESSPTLLLNRAAVNLKLQDYDAVIADCDEAIKGNTKSHLAYLRKGVALFHKDEFTKAKGVFEAGSSKFPTQQIFQTWVRKCTAELEQGSQPAKTSTPPLPQSQSQPQPQPQPKAQAEKKENVAPTPAPAPAPAATPAQTSAPAPSSKPAVKHEWFQSDTFVVVTVFIKNLKKEDVDIVFGKKTLSVTIKLPSGSDYSLELDLAQDIDMAGCMFHVLSTKVEIKLKKAIVGLKWAALESDEVRQAAEPKPQYPSSSKKAHNWDSLEKSVKKEEEEEKPDGEAGLNKLFQQIYANGSDEQRRAMMKSFVESGGTKLSTNWDDVGKEKQEITPPQGMEAKKYEF